MTRGCFRRLKPTSQVSAFTATIATQTSCHAAVATAMSYITFPDWSKPARRPPDTAASDQGPAKPQLDPTANIFTPRPQATIPLTRPARPAMFRQDSVPVWDVRKRIGMQADVDSLSDFPSLSGGQPQPGNNAAAAAAWNNNSAVRQAVPPQPQQQPAVQRPQQQPRAPSAAPSQHSIEQSYDGIRSQEATASRGTSDNEFPPLGGQNGFSNGSSSSCRSR